MKLNIFWRRRRTNYKFVFLTCALFLFIIHYKFVRNKIEAEISSSYSRNYFVTKMDEGRYNKMGYIVNTSQCQILDIDPWHSSILPYTRFDNSVVIDCGNQLQWTYVNKSTIVLNETAVEESGYVVAHISCCYRSILRDPRHFNKATGWYSPVVDSRVVYSKNCTPLQSVTEPDSDYIFVVCKPKNFYWYLDERLLSNVIYKNYHALVPNRKPNDVIEKMKYWQQCGNQIPGSVDNRPPNVIVLGIDSTSRLYFKRSMPKTTNILKQLGAHEMLGFNKVGDSTIWNMVSFVLGYTEAQLRKACWPTDSTKLDLCPFIWKRFSAANYITAEVQDSPRLNNWNFEIAGFVEPPTTFYVRPYMLGIHMNAGFYPNRVQCVGRQTMLETFLAYIKNLADFSQTSKIPIFMTSWTTQLAHDSSKTNLLRLGDAPFAEFLNGVISSGILDNTILIVASDHGFRYGGIRSTLAGYYEDKLPNLWIRLPPWMIRKYPEWEAALIHNSRMLSSGFHLYQTFNHILDTFSNTSEVRGERKPGSIINRTYGQSFFKPISENATCESSGIPESYCVCHTPTSLDQSSEILRKAAEASVKYVNGILPSQCAKLALLRPIGGAKIVKPIKYLKYKESKIIVEFSTEPGEFILEATVIHRKFNSTPRGSEYRVEKDVQRLSKFNTDVSCVKDHKLQQFCYC